jgi:hypothetical protein
MKKITTRAAWLHLAKAWDKAKGGEDRFVRVYIDHQRCLGVCHCLNFLRFSGAINADQWREMHEAINVKRRRLPNPDGYCWSLNKAGARARAKFCRKQAAKLKKKRMAT